MQFGFSTSRQRIGANARQIAFREIMGSMETTPLVLPSWAARETDHDPGKVGGKAVGLLALPEAWTPPFVVLTQAFSDVWTKHRKAGAVFEGSPDLWSPLDRLIGLARDNDRADGIIVRSNAHAESSDLRRGAYESMFVEADSRAIVGAIDHVLSQRDLDGTGLCAVVQVACRRVRGGHLSNGRRVTSRRTHWLAVELDPEGDPVGNSHILDSRNAGTLLSVPEAKGIAGALRAIANQLDDAGARWHCEWIWDGTRIWVVQRDVASDVKNDRLGGYLRGRDRSTAWRTCDAEALDVIQCVEAETAGGWSKSRKPVVFDALGMPTAQVFLLTGAAYLGEALSGGDLISSDLGSLMAGGRAVVVRCDVRAGCQIDDLSLPTSDPTTDPNDAIQFMATHAEACRRAGLSDNDWAFLPARLVPARASVMIHAKPGGQRVRLDALWGFPDGVGLLQHDRWFHDVPSDHFTEHVQYKGNCLAYDEQAGWQFQEVPEPHDWGHVLNESEAATASSWARRLADHLQREVQLMVLARIGGHRGPNAMLPWHYTDHVVADYTAAVARAPARGVLGVTCADDLPATLPVHTAGFRLQPTVEARRDPEFLTRLGKLAACSNLPVYFEGSVLGHPFYLLRSAGATVVPVGVREPQGVAHEYDKLVRDRIPEIAHRGGAAVRAVKTSSLDAGRLLRHKLVEEAFEVMNSDDDHLIGELADLVEVIRGFGVHTHATADRIEAVRAEKEASRGAFNDLVYLESTESSHRRLEQSVARSTLFDQSAEGTHPPTRQVVSEVVLRQPDERTLAFTVPLVPPLRAGVPLRQYDLRIGDVHITFTYAGTDLTIELEDVKPSQAAGQLSLAVET